MSYLDEYEIQSYVSLWAKDTNTLEYDKFALFAFVLDDEPDILADFARRHMKGRTKWIDPTPKETWDSSYEPDESMYTHIFVVNMNGTKIDIDALKLP